MRSIAFAAALVTWILAARPQVFTAAQARQHDGENVTICGKVTNQHTAASSPGKPIFLDLDSKFPNQLFAILVWEQDRQSVGELPHKGAHVCATGLINYYHGVPQMVVRSSKQLSP